MEKAKAVPGREFGFRVARIARRLRQAVDRELAAHGLTEATWRPLAYVVVSAKACGKGARRRSRIEGPSLVRLLDNLERRGLIERREQKGRPARPRHLPDAARTRAAATRPAHQRQYSAAPSRGGPFGRPRSL